MRIYGLAKTQAALEKVMLQASAAAPAASQAGAEVVAGQIIARAPRNTGATAASVRVESDGETAHAGPTTSYARFPEYGTRYMSGQHFMQDAANGSEGEVVTVIAAIMKVAVEA